MRRRGAMCLGAITALLLQMVLMLYLVRINHTPLVLVQAWHQRDALGGDLLREDVIPGLAFWYAFFVVPIAWPLALGVVSATLWTVRSVGHSVGRTADAVGSHPRDQAGSQV